MHLALNVQYSQEFLTSLLSTPSSIRNVAFVGHLHHGKTSLCDMLIEQTHTQSWNQRKQKRYTDTRKDEQQRGLSIKSTAFSAVLQAISGKSLLVNGVDTPGHPNFSDQMVASLQVADAAVIVVDCVEGVLQGTENAIRAAVRQGLPLVLVLNKLDRLVLELRLPPADAYFKLAYVISEVNAIAAGAAPSEGLKPSPLDPAAGNVLFGSAKHKWLFSLESFAHMYLQRAAGDSPTGGASAGAVASGGGSAAGASSVSPPALARRLWGDFYVDCPTGRFVRSAGAGASASGQPGAAPMSFVHFILEPIYKLYGQIVGEDTKTLTRTLNKLGLHVSRGEARADTNVLIARIFAQWLGSARGLVTAIADFAPSPVESAAFRVPRVWSGDLESSTGKALLACDSSGPLVINIVQQVASADGERLLAFGRVWSGQVLPDQQVRILGEGYSEEDTEESYTAIVKSVAVSQGRYAVESTGMPAGCLVLLDGLAGVIKKTATVVHPAGVAGADSVPAVFRPLSHISKSVMKLSVEPIIPGELPKLLDGLRRCAATYPLMQQRVEESGEHVVLYTGELGLDCIMHDLREMYGGVEVKVSDPVTSFAETVADTSKLQCFGETANGHNKLTMIAEPLDRGLPEDLEAGMLPPLHTPQGGATREVRDFLRGKYDWDILAASSVWATGPDARGPNMLLNDTLDDEVDTGLLGSVQEWITQGFQWSTREGPLADEPMRGVKVRLLDASLSDDPIHRGGGQIIPTARRVVYSSYLLASPRLMEPMMALEAQCPADAIEPIFKLLQRRRGHITSDVPIPGTPFYKVNGFIPAMDSFGFETDLRVHTLGLGFVTQQFDHWAIVPGDPLDRSIVLRPLEPSPPAALARDFMIKTRRRKGLSEDVSIAKFFDDAMLLEVARAEAEEAGSVDGDSASVGTSVPGEGSIVYSD